MDFSLPYYTIHQDLVAYRKAGIASVADLNGKSIGVQNETTAHYVLNNFDAIDIVAYDTITRAFEVLKNGGLQGVMCDNPVARHFITENGSPFTIALSMDSDLPEHYGFTVDKGEKAIVSLLNKGITSIRANGVEDAIVKKWFADQNSK